MERMTKYATTAERSLSESEKMQRLVALCEKLEEISLELKRRGYDTGHVPTWYYSHCKAIVNYIEGFARESKVKPSMLSAIKYRNSKRIPIVTTAAGRNRKKKTTTAAKKSNGSQEQQKQQKQQQQ